LHQERFPPKLPDASQTGSNIFGSILNCKIAYTYLYMPLLIWNEGVEYNFSPFGRVNVKCIIQHPRHYFWLIFQLDNLITILGIHNANKYVLSGYATLDLSNGEHFLDQPIMKLMTAYQQLSKLYPAY
jgi:hypothetical protein